jgi:hypothetical protein
MDTAVGAGMWRYYMSGPGDDTHPWPFSDRPVPFPLSSAPTTIKELVGRKCRVVRRGDLVTQEVEPGRVTIALSDNGRIEDVYFEPDLPSE